MKAVHETLQSLAEDNQLDEKLAEYAFFPLSHIFNETQRLSSPCLELTVRSVSILVSKGWRQHLVPEMGKQLLILMSLLAGGDPRRQNESPSDELKDTAFECMALIVTHMTITAKGKELFNDVSTKNIVDQLVYIALESMTESTSDRVQISASKALVAIFTSITNYMMLASLLPRTLSCLTKVLRPSTKARRTQNVLVEYLDLATILLESVLADEAISLNVENKDSKNLTAKHGKSTGQDVLDQSWLNATTPQVKIGLIHIVKLRNHDSALVRNALLKLCVMVIEKCPKTLSDSVSTMVETLIVLDRDKDTLARTTLDQLFTVNPEIADMVKSKFYDWLQALPRVMQANDDAPKRQMMRQIAASYAIMSQAMMDPEEISMTLSPALLEGLGAVEERASKNSQLIQPTGELNSSEISSYNLSTAIDFSPVILNHVSQREASEGLSGLLNVIQTHSASSQVVRYLINRIPDCDSNLQVPAIWLSLQLLKKRELTSLDMDDMVDFDSSHTELSLTKPYLVSDLYALTLPFLLQETQTNQQEKSDWRLIALSMESLVLQAQQLGISYRPELVDTLYPILSLLGSSNDQLRAHAMVALNLLSKACDYTSAGYMLVENADYLINAVGMKLNLFDISPQAPQVLLMLLRLCGVKIVPFLDDLVSTIFGAIDNFHGYPRLVEVLFQVLQALVDESAKEPNLTIKDGKETPNHKKAVFLTCTVDDIVQDLATRKRRKKRLTEDDQEIFSTPRQPWNWESVRPNIEEKTVNPEIGDDADKSLDVDDNQNKESAVSKTHQLLLNIAESTTPHFSSPSPRVRQILLELLGKIVPLLAQHENTFLPLINSIWPGLMSRLFSPTGDEIDNETVYNICGAAEVTSQLCVHAGDFMSSRVEDIFAPLHKLFVQTYSRLFGTKSKALGNIPRELQGKSRLRGPITLQVTQQKIGLTSQQSVSSQLSSRSIRTGDGQILNALIRLFISILSYVHITEDNGDQIMQLLAPMVDSTVGKEIEETMVAYNADAFWLIMEREKRSTP